VPLRNVTYGPGSTGLEPIKGFLSGSRVVADPVAGRVSAIDITTEFFTTYPPPSYGRASRFPRDLSDRLQFFCSLQSPDNEDQFRRRLLKVGVEILELKKFNDYQCVLTIPANMVKDAFDSEDNAAFLTKQLTQNGITVFFASQNGLRFGDDDGRFVSEAFNERADFEDAYISYYISSLQDLILEQYRRYVRANDEEAAFLQRTLYPVLDLVVYGRRRDGPIFGKYYSLKPGMRLYELDWSFPRPIDLSGLTGAIGDVYTFVDLLERRQECAEHFNEPSIKALLDVIGKKSSPLFETPPGATGFELAQAASAFRRVCEITNARNPSGPTSANSDCVFLDRRKGIIRLSR